MLTHANEGQLYVDSEETLAARAQRLERTVAALRRREHLLAEENLRLADLLKEHGIVVRVSSHVARELPPALTGPAEREAGAFLLLCAEERALLDELLGGEQAVFLVCSGTDVDVGQWIRKRAAWLCATRSELVVFALGRRPFSARIPFQLLRESLYNHVTGALALAPAHGLEPREYRMTPTEGYQLLAQFYMEVDRG
jgi:hypothetical protein